MWLPKSKLNYTLKRSREGPVLLHGDVKGGDFGQLASHIVLAWFLTDSNVTGCSATKYFMFCFWSICILSAACAGKLATERCVYQLAGIGCH